VQILDLIADSLSNGEIGQRLGWSTRAVTAYISSILRKLGDAGRE
jgi:DNA-binding CsgD family transcriptional regulator